MSVMIEIDGSQGEGGGQIVRSSLALSAITGKPVRIFNLRAGRRKPGLARQHLTAVNAAAKICGADVTGNEMHSLDLKFSPGKVRAGDYDFSIGSAGSSILVAQTVLPPLMLADGPSTISVRGGTHNEKAPPFEYLKHVYLPLVQRMGPAFKAHLRTHGFYPKGGGRISIAIEPVDSLRGLTLNKLIVKSRPVVKALVANLPLSIARRECDAVRKKSNWGADRFGTIVVADSLSPGNVLQVYVESEQLTELFTSFGKIGIKAEQVAAAAYREANDYLKAQAPVGPHLADQLLLPMGLAASDGHDSSMVTTSLTDHSLSHIEILKMFLDINIEVLQGGDLVTVRVASMAE